MKMKKVCLSLVSLLLYVGLCFGGEDEKIYKVQVVEPFDWNFSDEPIYYNGKWVKEYSKEEFDSNGNSIRKDIKGVNQYKKEYDANSNLIYREDYSTDRKFIYTYKYSAPIKKYDNNGNLTYEFDSDTSSCHTTRYKYDSNNNLIYKETVYCNTRHDNLLNCFKVRYDLSSCRYDFSQIPYYYIPNIDFNNYTYVLFKQYHNKDAYKCTTDDHIFYIEDHETHEKEFFGILDDNSLFVKRNNHVSLYPSESLYDIQVYKTYYEYDSNNNLTRVSDSDGITTYKNNYSTDGKLVSCLIHFPDGSEEESDSNGNKIYYKYWDGYESWREYDSNGNKIHCKYSDGHESWYEYDSNGKLIHYKNSKGYEELFEYDSKGNEIHYKNSDGHESWYEYDSNGNKIYYKNSDGYEKWYEYDLNGKETHYKDSDGYEEWYNYSFEYRYNHTFKITYNAAF